MTRLRVARVGRDDANAFVAAIHRHHQPPQGQVFSVGVVDATGLIVGVAIVGRPVARPYDDGWTCEVTRVCTDGAANACSMLYGACWRAARAMGFTRAFTYTQASESGASLRAAGWTVDAELDARAGWSVPSRPREDRGADGVARLRWRIQASEYGLLSRPHLPAGVTPEIDPPLDLFSALSVEGLAA